MQGRRITQNGTVLTLEAPSFSVTLDTGDGLRALRWDNVLASDALDLGGHPELELDVDRAQRRIGITGWRGQDIPDSQDLDPDGDPGYRAAYQDPAFDDAQWTGMLNAAQSWYFDDGRYCWVRTHVFLPSDVEEARELTLVLGGQGLFDYRYMRAFVNGHELGVRETSGRWSEPSALDLSPDSPIRPVLRFGQDNVIALQLRGYITRTARLDQLDPERARQYPLRCTWPAQFEQLVVAGPSHETSRFLVDDVRVLGRGQRGVVVVELVDANLGAAASVRYAWSKNDDAVRRTVVVRNTSTSALRILNVRSGTYETGRPVSDGEMGSPVFVDDAYALSLAHPAGWAMGADGWVRLRQYPGRMLSPGEDWEAMEGVFLVSPRGAISDAFRRHVRQRSRRVHRGHDTPLAILEPFGSWDYDRATATGRYAENVSDEETEEGVLQVLARVGDAERETGLRFDLCSIDFWVDRTGDLARFDPGRFPEGLDRIRPRLDALGMRPGLWIDSSWEEWSIGGNPVVSSTYTHDPAYGTERPTLCRATDPIRTMYSTGFVHHIRENGARLLKFDNLQSVCYAPGHPHLPGRYSTEAIFDGVLESFRAFDAAAPDVFLMCYWGYRSPWWLLDADTLFEPGIFVEAAHPAGVPTLYARDSVTVGLDQAQWFTEDVPWLGKDSLGVWLSDWKWNSSIGSERWAEAFVMDICRGSLLAQPWSDRTFLDDTGRRLLADLVALLRENAAAFDNGRFVVGSPWRDEPYGYLCTDGQRAFVAVNNATWQDASVTLGLGQAWGLPEGPWDLYRWYPRPARLEPVDGAETRLWLRPFEVFLLEAVPAGTPPSLGRTFGTQMLRPFVEAARAIEPAVTKLRKSAVRQVPYERRDQPLPAPVPPKTAVRVRLDVPAVGVPATIAVTASLRYQGAAHVLDNTGQFFTARAVVAGQPAEAVPVVREWTLPVPWQAWRIDVLASGTPRIVDLEVTLALEPAVDVLWEAHLVPS